MQDTVLDRENDVHIRCTRFLQNSASSIVKTNETDKYQKPSLEKLLDFLADQVYLATTIMSSYPV